MNNPGIYFRIWAAACLMIASCNHKEQTITPNISNEVITTVQVQLTNQANKTDIQTATWEQLVDANGKPQPVDVSKANLTLKSNATYTASITVLDKSQNPVDDHTLEIEDRSNIHLFFLQPLPTASALVIPTASGELYPEPIPTPIPNGAPLNLTVSITDKDTNNPPLPLGLESIFTTGNASTGWLRIVLRHQPSGKDGTFAPGDTDLDVGYNVTIQ